MTAEINIGKQSVVLLSIEEALVQREYDSCSVCLIVDDMQEPLIRYEMLADRLLGLGVSHIMTWGSRGQDIEDIVDTRIETSPVGKHQTVATTYHTDDSIWDTCHFLLFAAEPDNFSAVRWIVLSKNDVVRKEWHITLEEIRLMLD